jgi:23S rRNA (uridine2552-2'-O)-methyltransferase
VTKPPRPPPKDIAAIGEPEAPPKRRMVRPPSGGVTRAIPARLKTARDRTPSSQAWLERQINDPFAAQARAQGYRSRAAFKLAEMDDRFALIRRGGRIIDLGCAPGGWLQIAVERGAGRVAGVDLIAIDPVPPAVILQGDMLDPAIQDQLIAAIGGRANLVLSDMAPNTTGHQKTDHLRIAGLIEAAVVFVEAHLEAGGSFVTKAFQGGETAPIITGLKTRFVKVRHVKPKASRAQSSEVYIVATGFRG